MLDGAIGLAIGLTFRIGLDCCRGKYNTKTDNEDTYTK